MIQICRAVAIAFVTSSVMPVEAQQQQQKNSSLVLACNGISKPVLLPPSPSAEKTTATHQDEELRTLDSFVPTASNVHPAKKGECLNRRVRDEIHSRLSCVAVGSDIERRRHANAKTAFS